MARITGGGRAERSGTKRNTYSASLGSPAVASTTGVHAAVTDTGAPQTITTGITSPAVPRNITATAGGTSTDIKAIAVTVTGTDVAGNVLTEVLPAFTVDTAGTVVGSKAFATVTSISIPAHDGTGATTAIGFGAKLGLPAYLSRDSVLAGYVNGAREATRPVALFSTTVLASNTVTFTTAFSGVPVVVDYMD